eukprot:CAMPEP_0195527574 /NCGR_PEP_ID=MMETSP0794_2-20130614/29339_1 /TAXON_ID=515487 /ORGANISM="Stephanopyxis turris, Strain CCMP 815" /LENGTH=482 /DNA_ID=CAMNT_0040658517 /DNA_START=80 /DNA_END=1528 /DNA_ORIENTATION=+
MTTTTSPCITAIPNNNLPTIRNQHNHSRGSIVPNALCPIPKKNESIPNNRNRNSRVRLKSSSSLSKRAARALNKPNKPKKQQTDINNNDSTTNIAASGSIPPASSSSSSSSSKEDVPISPKASSVQNDAEEESGTNHQSSSQVQAHASPASFHVQSLHEFAPRIVVVGVGGGGGNAVNNMIAQELTGVDFLALNTDAQHLSTTLTDNRIQIGASLTGGLGCGANPDAGRLAAEESQSQIIDFIGDAHMVFITAGMGGGTGTGAAPVVADLCYNNGILTVGVVTKPFSFEGTHRMRLANEGLDKLRNVVDTMLVIPNQNLFKLVEQQTSFIDSFKLADDVLLAGVRGITDLMTSPGLINLDFADVQSVMHGMGNAMLGTGRAEGEDRATKAAEMALKNPLLGDMDISTAKGMLVNITGGSDMTLWEVDQAAQKITQVVQDPSANIIFGSAFDTTLEGAIQVSVVATGIDDFEEVKGEKLRDRD